MSQLKSGVALAEGERLVMEIEAELWARSSNPITRLIGAVQRIFALIIGYRKKGFLIITDQRVIVVAQITQCYVFVTDKIIKYVLPSSVKEVGYTKTATCGFLCPRYELFYESFTDGIAVQLKGGKESDALNAANAFYAALFKAKI